MLKSESGFKFCSCGIAQRKSIVSLFSNRLTKISNECNSNRIYCQMSENKTECNEDLCATKLSCCVHMLHKSSRFVQAITEIHCQLATIVRSLGISKSSLAPACYSEVPVYLTHLCILTGPDEISGKEFKTSPAFQLT